MWAYVFQRGAALPDCMVVGKAVEEVEDGKGALRRASLGRQLRQQHGHRRGEAQDVREEVTGN